MRRKLSQIVMVAVLIALPSVTRAYTPNGWVYFSWPYMYNLQSQTWLYFNESDTQRCYNFSRNVWEQLRTSSLASGWSYFQWPYDFDAEANSWFYINENDTQWVYSFYLGSWLRLGEDYCSQQWVICDIYCGVGIDHNSAPCRAQCLNKYNTCLKDGYWP